VVNVASRWLATSHGRLRGKKTTSAVACVWLLGACGASPASRTPTGSVPGPARSASLEANAQSEAPEPANPHAPSPDSPGTGSPEANAQSAAAESVESGPAALEIEVVIDKSSKSADADCAVTSEPRKLRLRVRAGCPDKPRVWVTLKAADKSASDWTEGPTKYSPEGALATGKWSEVLVPIPASKPPDLSFLSVEFVASCVSGDTMVSKRGTTQCRLPSRS
jgi:hypothetical protein